MKYYAIADLHGRYDLLSKSLDAVYNKIQDDDKIITLGDYIDRGPDSSRIIQKLIDLQQDDKRLVCLKGNHEDIMLQAIDDPYLTYWWYQNGGLATQSSYMGMPDDEHVAWVRGLPCYYETPKHVFVHAGVPTDDPLEDQSKERLMWMLYAKDDHGGWGFPKENGKHVVHGHHIHEDGPLEWQYRTALDTGSFFTDRQVIGVFDDTQGRAIDFIEVKA